MPREYLHWLVVDRYTAKLPEVAKTAIDRHQDSALLGAIAHDAPYYERFGASRFELVAERLHGSDGEDTLLPLKQLILNSRSSADKMVFDAFLIGFLSHIALDIVFHPVVYYFTGDYYHPDKTQRKDARTRHRLFEVYLDHWAQKHFHSRHFESIHRLIANLDEEYPKILSLLEQSLSGEDGSWASAFGKMALCQRAFLSYPFGFLMRALKSFAPTAIAPFDALFSYGRDRDLEVFDKPLEFKHPSTGEHRRESLDRLFDEAGALWIELVGQCLPALEAQNSTSIIELPKGRSLNTGLFQSHKSDLKFFSPAGFPLPGLTIGT